MTLEAKTRSPETAGNVVALTDAKSTAPASPANAKGDEVMIHVRFHPNALVNTIDCCPEHLTAQQWYMHLALTAPSNYQVFAGGRGVFRIERNRFEAILNQSMT